MTDRAFGCGPSVPTTSGPTTSSRNAPMRDANFACSTSSTSSLTNAWPFGYPAGSNRSTSSTYYQICSSCEVFPSTFAPTTARSSSPRRCSNGLPPSGLRPLTSRPAARGRTAFESFNARLRDELLNGEIFYTVREAQIVIESWRRHYNRVRPHASIGYRPPAPEVFVPALAAWPATPPQPAPPAMLPLLRRPTLN